jgi:hypothetical protein
VKESTKGDNLFTVLDIGAGEVQILLQTVGSCHWVYPQTGSFLGLGTLLHNY